MAGISVPLSGNLDYSMNAGGDLFAYGHARAWENWLELARPFQPAVAP